jgi:hypothetical protein
MAGVITWKEGIEPESCIDDLILEALGPGSGVGQASQNDGVLTVLIGLLLDHEIEPLEILGREAIQDPRIADFCQSALNGALPIGDFARNQQHDVAGTLPTAETQPIAQ